MRADRLALLFVSLAAIPYLTFSPFYPTIIAMSRLYGHVYLPMTNKGLKEVIKMPPESLVEDEYQDVLQNIEFGIVSIYRIHSEMTDWDALNAVEGLIRTYQAEGRGRSAPSLSLDSLSQKVFNSVHPMCEWRLGREKMMVGR